MNPFNIGDIGMIVDVSSLGGEQAKRLQHIGEVIDTIRIAVGDERVRLQFIDGYRTGNLKIHRVAKIE